MSDYRPLGASPVPAVLSVVVRDGRLLLVRRANPPDKERWGFPGGHIEPGETLFAAATRELQEETGVVAGAEQVLTALDVIDRHPSGDLAYHFVLIAVRCRWYSGLGQPGDDALETGWFTADEVADLGPEASRDVETIARMVSE